MSKNNNFYDDVIYEYNKNKSVDLFLAYLNDNTRQLKIHITEKDIKNGYIIYKPKNFNYYDYIKIINLIPINRNFLLALLNIFYSVIKKYVINMLTVRLSGFGEFSGKIIKNRKLVTNNLKSYKYSNKTVFDIKNSIKLKFKPSRHSKYNMPDDMVLRDDISISDIDIFNSNRQI